MHKKKLGVWRLAGLPVGVIRLFDIFCEGLAAFEASLVLDVGSAVCVALWVIGKA